MKNLSFFNKIVFFFNSVVAFLLLLSYVLPLIPPKTFSTLSVLSLSVPFLILLNVLFFVYWLIKIKKQFLLSLIILIVGYLFFGSLYKFSRGKTVASEGNISIMNYNVRLFNIYNWIPEKNVEKKLVNFVKKEKPDILCLQEYRPHENVDLSFMPYRYEKISGKKFKHGQVIFSKYPIINSGSVAFPNTSNNAIYADVIKGKDTIRIYNIHLQSLHIDTNVESLAKEDSEELIKGVGETFKMQQLQTELFLENMKACKYPVLIAGDFNNTAFSYVYREIRGDLKDAFKEAGNGFGRTYNFKFFPVRIDFVLADTNFKVNAFKTYDVEYSDHYPVMAKVSLED